MLLWPTSVSALSIVPRRAFARALSGGFCRTLQKRQYSDLAAVVPNFGGKAP